MNPRLTSFIALKLLGLYFLLEGIAAILSYLVGIVPLFQMEIDPLDRLFSALFAMSIPTFQCVAGLGMVLLTEQITVFLGFTAEDEKPAPSPAAPGKAWYAAGLSFAAILALLPAWHDFVMHLFISVNRPEADASFSSVFRLGAPLYCVAPILVLVFAWPLGSVLHSHHRRMLARNDDSAGDEEQE
jgi:hypothetical protein